MTTPEVIFIVPYRDRQTHCTFFRKHMKSVMEDFPPFYYRICFVHQRDNRPFNRGALKNIGFLAMKKAYPADYKEITFVFNDIDTMPFVKDHLHYKTTPGVVKHFYGFRFALGGVVSLLGSDFEKINGFPNFWAWGYEDNELQRRVLMHKQEMTIDRSEFYDILSQDFIHLQHGFMREANFKEKQRYGNKSLEGILDITQEKYILDEENDMIHVDYFETGTEPIHSLYATFNCMFESGIEQSKNRKMKMFF